MLYKLNLTFAFNSVKIVSVYKLTFKISEFFRALCLNDLSF